MTWRIWGMRYFPRNSCSWYQENRETISRWNESRKSRNTPQFRVPRRTTCWSTHTRCLGENVSKSSFQKGAVEEEWRDWGFLFQYLRYNIKQLAEFYMNHREYINNWDLVDTSAEHIIGPYIEQCLTHEERMKFIDDCIASPHLWTNRIIILASFYQIKKWDEKPTFSIVPRFLNHPHDLMHKACGWMLREVGKRIDENKLCKFLDEYATRMPRTMLRYAIERLDEEKKMSYMKR